MKRHVAHVHKNKKSYKCNMCFKIYKANADLKRHIATIHEGKNSNVNPVRLVTDHY